MDAVEYLKTLRRMCNAECRKCEFGDVHSVNEGCSTWRTANPEAAVAIAENWAKKHPAKTRQSEFLKHYPDAQIDSGCLNACPMDVFGNMGINCNKQTCYECKKKFWLAEVEEGKDENGCS